MDELVAFVRACLDEDKRAILDRWDSDGRARIATMWTGGEPGYTTVASDQSDGVWIADGREVDDARHVLVLFDPARMLADVAAKRAILGLAQGMLDEADEQDKRAELSIYEEGGECQRTDARAIIRALAQPFAGRPGWREEWAT